MWTYPFSDPPRSDSERMLDIRKSADREYAANKERKKRACDSYSCRLECGGTCFTGEPDKCDWWFEREIAAQERKREGDR
jgi:hypothetical protein